MREKLLKILYEINPDVDYENEEGLVSNDCIDSLEIMQIVVGIDEAFGVDIDAESISIENFDSVDKIMELIIKSKK